MSQLHSIQNEDDYEAALNKISIFFDNEPALGSKQSTRFESLLNLIDAYESKNYSINSSNTGPQV